MREVLDPLDPVLVTSEVVLVTKPEHRSSGCFVESLPPRSASRMTWQISRLTCEKQTRI